MPRTILLVDDNTLVRRLLRSWLEDHSEWNICGEAENGQVAIEKVAELRPDIVILDFQMPQMSGLEAAKEIKRIAPRTPMILFSVHASPQLLREARAYGVHSVVSKCDMIGENLLSALRQAAAPD